MKTRTLRILLALYTMLILVIIVTANLGGTHEMFHFVTQVPQGDKIAHFALFGLLALLVDLAARRRDTRLLRLRIPTGPTVLFGLVFLEELSQLAMATRTFDLGDLTADALGMTLFVVLGRYFLKPEPEPELEPKTASPPA